MLSPVRFHEDPFKPRLIESGALAFTLGSLPCVISETHRTRYRPLETGPSDDFSIVHRRLRVHMTHPREVMRSRLVTIGKA